jgi:hypothetical protein
MILIKFGKTGHVKIEEPSRMELVALAVILIFFGLLTTCWKVFF